jgi:hypothetical protein
VFGYHEKYLFFCEKIIFLFMKIQNRKIKLTVDKQFSKTFLEIGFDDVVLINKRQINLQDRSKFSIFYRDQSNRDKNSVREIKLKCSNAIETDSWINNLKKLIIPKQFIFQINDEEKLLKHKLSIKNVFVKTRILEDIINKFHKREFIQYLFENRKQIICKLDESLSKQSKYSYNSLSSVEEEEIGLQFNSNSKNG